MTYSEETKWIEDHGRFVCPFCKTEFDCNIPNYNLTNGSIPKYCPECGEKMIEEVKEECSIDTDKLKEKIEEYEEKEQKRQIKTFGNYEFGKIPGFVWKTIIEECKINKGGKRK